MNRNLIRLSKRHEVPNPTTVGFHMRRLQRMKAFYEEKIELAPDKQALMFKDFVKALGYAELIINGYQELTLQLSALSKEDGDDAIDL